MKSTWDRMSFGSRTTRLKLIMSPIRAAHYATQSWENLPIEIQTALDNLDTVDEMTQR